MKIHLVSFGSGKFKKSIERIREQAIASGFFTDLHCIKSSDLPIGYRIKYFRYLNKRTRGYGYWMWKSYIIKKVFDQMEKDDILVYVDAGCTINKQGKNRFLDYIEMLKNSEYSNLSFRLTHPEIKFTKRELINFLEVQNNSEILNSGQLMATVFFVRKDKQSEELIEKYFNISHYHINLINDSPSTEAENSQFIDHRHDQSVFSLLRKKYGSLILDDETYFDQKNREQNTSLPFHAKRIRE